MFEVYFIMSHCLTLNNIEAELSFAYIKAVASMAGMSCDVTNRTEDDNGIDARITARGNALPDNAIRTEVTINIQLKATKQNCSNTESAISFFIKGKERYNNLVDNKASTPVILVVYFLPEDAEKWLYQNKKALILRGGAYWTSLMGKEETHNKSGETVYIPKNQLFTVTSLQTLAGKIANFELPKYTFMD